MLSYVPQNTGASAVRALLGERGQGSEGFEGPNGISSSFVAVERHEDLSRRRAGEVRVGLLYNPSRAQGAPRPREGTIPPELSVAYKSTSLWPVIADTGHTEDV